MRICWLTFILIVVAKANVCPDNTTVSSNTEAILSRRKRQLTFPKGTSFVVTLSGLKAIQVSEPSNWNLAMEFDLIWPIPSQTGYSRKTFGRRRESSKLKRRHRRDLYANIESALISRNLPGKECVLRTICEARTLLLDSGISLIDDILRVLLNNGDDFEEQDDYDFAYNLGRDCDTTYLCPFSVLRLILLYIYDEIF